METTTPVELRIEDQHFNTLRDYVRVLFRQKWVVLTALIIVTAVIFVGLKMQTSTYESTVKILISAEKQVESPYYREMAGYNKPQPAITQSEVVKSSPILELTVKALELHRRPLDYEKEFASPLKSRLIDTSLKSLREQLQSLPPQQAEVLLFQRAVNNLRSNITVDPIKDSNMFIIRVQDFHPLTAALIANVVSRAYVIFDLQQQLAEVSLKYGDKYPTVKQLKDNIQAISANLTGNPVSAIDAIGPASVKIIEQASIPIHPLGKPKGLVLILAGIMGLGLGIALAFIFEYMDQSFKSSQDIERSLNVSVLGALTKPNFLLGEWPIIRNFDRKTRYFKDYQMLCDQMYLLMKDKNLKSLLVSDVIRGEGAATVLTNFSCYLAHKFTKKVLIVDANMRDPQMHKIFKCPNDAGLADLLERKIDLDKAIKFNAYSHVDLMTAGVPEGNPMALLDSEYCKTVLKTLQEKYTAVIVNCADLRQWTDAGVLISQVDGVVLVVKEGGVRQQVARKIVAALRQRSNLLGVIFNNRTFAIPGMIYHWV